MPLKSLFKSRELLKAFDALSTPCVIYKGENDVVFVNRAAREQWPILYQLLDEGVPRRRAIYEQVKAQFPHRDAEKIQKMADVAFEATISNVNIDLPASQNRLMRTEHYPFSDDMALGISVDVTELRMKERELAKALQVADAANRAKSEFLAKMTHEIRTPMNGVLGIAELMALTDMDEVQQMYNDTIRKSSKILLGIVNEALDLAKIEAGGMELTMQPFDPIDVLREVGGLLAPLAKTAGLELSLEAPRHPFPQPFGDSGKLRQVLTNLVGNAIKFTPEGYVIARLIVEEQEDDTIVLCFEVDDTGPGIPLAERENVFGRFNRGSAVQGAQGAGLGLAITKELVDRMGGNISIGQSASGGARFRVELTLPCEPVEIRRDLSA